MSPIYKQCKRSGATSSLNAMKCKEVKEFYLLQKITITSLVLTTTAGLQMVAPSTKRLVVKDTRSTRISTESFRFKDNIGIRPGVLIRPDTQLVLGRIHCIYIRLLFQRVTSVFLYIYQ